MEKESRRSLLDDYLLNPKLDLADVVAMACDVLLTGVDTVHLHIEFLFLHSVSALYSICVLLFLCFLLFE